MDGRLMTAKNWCQCVMPTGGRADRPARFPTAPTIVRASAPPQPRAAGLHGRAGLHQSHGPALSHSFAAGHSVH